MIFTVSLGGIVGLSGVWKVKVNKVVEGEVKGIGHVGMFVEKVLDGGVRLESDVKAQKRMKVVLQGVLGVVSSVSGEWVEVVQKVTAVFSRRRGR